METSARQGGEDSSTEGLSRQKSGSQNDFLGRLVNIPRETGYGSSMTAALEAADVSDRR
jgi:hypothetical protein